MDQRKIESVGLFLLLSVKKGTLLKVLKNELGGGKQRKISAKFELRPYAVYNGVRYLEGAGLRYKVVNGREEEWNGVDLSFNFCG